MKSSRSTSRKSRKTRTSKRRTARKVMRARKTRKSRSSRRTSKSMSRKTVRKSKRQTSRRTTRKTSRKAMTTKSPQTTMITGQFEGDITSSGHLCFTHGSKCKANVKAGSVQVDGAVAGNVYASGAMKLGRRSYVNGTIVAERLSCADGATFVGRCMLGRMKKAA